MLRMRVFEERTLLASALLIVASSFASAQETAKVAPDLFRAVDAQTEAVLVTRAPRKILEQQFHAKEGRFGIFEFDADLLTRGRGEFEVNVFGDKMTFKVLEFQPYGQGHHPSSGAVVYEMAGESKGKRNKQTLSVIVYAVTPEGEWVLPDPNRDAVLKAQQDAQEGKPAMMLGSSLDRLDEELVTTISGMLQYRDADGRYQRLHVNSNRELPGYSIVREIDGDKTTQINHGGYPEGSAMWQKVQDARAEKAEYMQRVDADIASGAYSANPNQN